MIAECEPSDGSGMNEGVLAYAVPEPVPVRRNSGVPRIGNFLAAISPFLSTDPIPPEIQLALALPVSPIYLADGKANRQRWEGCHLTSPKDWISKGPDAEHMEAY